MKSFYTILVVFLFHALQCEISAQCPECTPDETCGEGENFPTICPSILPTGVTGEYYEETLTFFLPPTVEDQGVTATLDEIVVSSINGVPFGMEVTVNDDDNTFYPNNGDNYGCATLCGTPLQDGLFDISINVLVTVTAFGFEQELNESFILQLVVEEGELGNSSFSFSDAAGCGELQVDFEALIDGSPNPTEYAWDFGNGNLSDQANPSSQTYGPGSYTASLETTIYQFVLEEVEVNSLSTDGNNDADELFGLLAMDPYLVVVNEDGVAVYTSETINGSDNATFSSLSIILNNPGYSIQIWDSDTITADDLLGEFNLGDLASGDFPFNDGGTQGVVSVNLEVSSQFVDSQDITVFEMPNAEFTYNEIINVLSYSNENNDSYTWTLNGDTLDNTEPVQNLELPGVYQCIVSTEFGCEAVSSEYIVCPEVEIDINFENEELSTTAGFESYEWFYNGLPISGEDSEFIEYQGAGNYGLTITTSYGCEVSSEVVSIDLAIGERSVIEFSLYPNPTRDFILVKSAHFSSDYSLRIINSQGQLIRVVKPDGTTQIEISLTNLPAGRYVLQVLNNQGIISTKNFLKL